MRIDLSFRRLSLKAKLITSYLVILGIGGLVTSFVGSWIVSSTIMAQARRSVNHDLATARTVYQDRLDTLRRSVQLAASGITISQHLADGDHRALIAYLEPIRSGSGFDFLTLADPRGRVLLRVSQPEHAGDDVSSMPVVRAALQGRVASATEILTAAQLENEAPSLRIRARFQVLPTPLSGPPGRAQETSGMVLLAATPVRAPDGRILAALYGGSLLSRNFDIVDRVWELIFKGERFANQDVGTVTIFQNDLRIATNVRTASGERALGTRASREVRDAVLGNGTVWRGRAFVVRDWYISAYEPIRNDAGAIVGMLYVGVLEKAYTSIRDRVILSFFGIATSGFILIICITYYEIRNITRPIGEIVAATRNITAGRFDQEVNATAQGELALLADSFNAMLRSLRQMKGDLEEWGRTLEEKVKERTQELVAMQARVAQSERLASLGMLAAGVAHEINNPLGGVLALTALTLEDLKPDDQNRENLEEVLKQAERCRRIVRGLLEFSRQSQANAELLNLNEVLEGSLSLIAKQALFFNIVVRKQWATDLPPVMADKSQLQQVFTNILVNAAQAMDEKGTISIATRYAEREDAVEVLIADTGRGIPPEAIDQIFDPFFTTKTSGEGTGLGLSIAYGIITKHRGTIAVKSDPGRGTTFTIRLPVAARIREKA